MLSPDEVARYARHIVLRDVGGPGQERLKAARALVVGAGGLGAPLIQYLAAAGVGRLSIVDDDTVSLSNLQRQVIHATGSVGAPKVDSAAAAVARINPHVRVDTHCLRLDSANAGPLMRGHDVILDGSDNFSTRYLAADAAEEQHIPLVTAAVGTFDGSITTLAPHLTDETGSPYPRYRDLFPAPPPDGLLPTCAQAGILGALPGILGSLMAMEALKLILGIGRPLLGRLLLIDALSMRFETIGYGRPR